MSRPRRIASKSSGVDRTVSAAAPGIIDPDWYPVVDKSLFEDEFDGACVPESCALPRDRSKVTTDSPPELSLLLIPSHP